MSILSFLMCSCGQEGALYMPGSPEDKNATPEQRAAYEKKHNPDNSDETAIDDPENDNERSEDKTAKDDNENINSYSDDIIDNNPGAPNKPQNFDVSGINSIN